MDMLCLGIFNRNRELWFYPELYTAWVQMDFSQIEDNDQVCIWKLFQKFIIYSGLNEAVWVSLMINLITGWYIVGYFQLKSVI